MKRFLSLLLLIAGALLFITSCKKSDKYEATRLPVDGNAFLRIVHVSPNFTAALGVADNYHVYIDQTKINGAALVYATATTTLTKVSDGTTAGTYPNTVTAFPVQALNINTYTAVRTGTANIRLSLAGKNLVDSLTFLTIPVNLGKNSYYTLFVSDSIGKTPAKYLVQDLFGKPDTGMYAVRFAHMVVNDTVGKNVDVYSTKQAQTIFSNVAPSAVTGFLNFKINPTIPSIPDTIIIRRAGTTNELTRYPPNNVAGVAVNTNLATVSYTNNQRVYTIIYKGHVSTTTGAKARSLIWINNR
jgi:hypothetical protein